MPVAEPLTKKTSSNGLNPSLLRELDKTIAELNAPARSQGPNLLKLGGLVFKLLFFGANAVKFIDK